MHLFLTKFSLLFVLLCEVEKGDTSGV